MRVQRGAPSLRPGIVVAEKGPQLGPFFDEAVVVLVEDLGHRTPTAPASQHALLVQAGPAVLGLASLENSERGEVGVEPRSMARGGKIRLALGPERRWAASR